MINPNNRANDELTNNVIQASPDIVATIDALKRVEEIKKRVLELEDNLKTKITGFMSLNQILKSDDFTLATWKNQSRNSFDITEFRKHYAMTSTPYSSKNPPLEYLGCISGYK